MDARDAHAVIREAAAGLGFRLGGVASARPVRKALEALSSWVDAGHHADLGYMGRNPPERADPRTLMEGVRSVVTVAVDHGPPSTTFDAEGRYGRVARYAWGLDYHDVVIPRLEALAACLAERLPGVGASRAACDHSPLLERAFAERAGLGFIGKNTCLLIPRRGSFHLLGEVLLDVDLPATPASSKTQHCGTCTSCLDACPTNAFPAPFVLDARRCISYLTIEHKGVVPRDLRAGMGAWVFGCDVCQEVCPFNRYEAQADWPALDAAAGAGERLDLVDVLSIPTDEAFRERFRGTPLLRPKRRGLLGNAAIVSRNVGCDAAADVLARLAAEDAEPLVRAHALWALFGLAPEEARSIAARAVDGDADETVRGEARRGLDEDAS